MSLHYKLLATDIDGTLTINRSTTTIDPQVFYWMKKVEEKGIIIALISSNALPVVVGLKKYVGLKGPAVGESGAYIYYTPDNIVALTNKNVRKVYEDVVAHFKEYVVPSWQNLFRYYDFALKIKKEYRGNAWSIYEDIKNYVESKYAHAKVGYSGYAIHIKPVDVDKGRAVEHIMREYGLSQDNVIAVGDSVMDIELFRVAGLRIAVANADNELKKQADIVLKKPSGYGFLELARMLIENRI